MNRVLKFLKYKLVPLTLSALLALGLAACGKSGDVAGNRWVYVPEFLSLEGAADIRWYDVRLVEDNLYYISDTWDEETRAHTSFLHRYSLSDGTADEVELSLPEGVNLDCWTIGVDGCLYAALVIWDWNEATGISNNTYMVAKYDTQGKELFVRDFTDILEGESYLDSIAVDGEGRIYISEHSAMWLFDAEGNPSGNVNLGFGMGGWINCYCRGTDGRVYAAVTSYDGNSSSTELSVINFEKKSLESSYTDFPSAEMMAQDAEENFVVHDRTSVYMYRMKDQKKELLFDWLDCDINGDSIRALNVLSDGRIVAVYEDWNSNESGMVALNRVSADEVKQKQKIVLGMMYQDSELEAAVVDFNKSSDTYHVTIRHYIDYDNWSETSVSDAQTRLNSDIISNNCPDILCLSGINVQQLAAKGVFEDLSPYLEKSSLDRSDKLENVLDAYTYDDRLICIPKRFTVSTIIGSAAQVGEKMGWTLEEMIAFADAHPAAQLFDRMYKEEIMRCCLTYNADSFVDWKTGTCSFDSDEFKALLEFVGRFPSYEEMTNGDGQASMPERIQKGEVLLSEFTVDDLDDMQLYLEMFGGPVTCIGYPNSDGSSGAVLAPRGAYAITSRSQVKEGAWAFIESYLTWEENRYSRWGFPNSRSELARMADEEVNVEYVLDENGEPMLDAHGNPMVVGGGSKGWGWDDWEYYYRVPTQEEVDMVLELIQSARMGSDDNEQIMSIINEEAAPFFQGQKSVDDAASTIQSRVQVYVDENR
ncbi:MAG: extracellular solute-binding protein [Acetatifactor sp.]|nr:extracellular solute-binding protein [Acetatifactor sp.]